MLKTETRTSLLPKMCLKVLLTITTVYLLFKDISATETAFVALKTEETFQHPTYLCPWDLRVYSLVGIYIPNLNDTCLRCLCHVSGCDLSHRCNDGYCGPFYISRIYWVDAGKPTLDNDTPERKEAYEDCARDNDCSKNIVVGYMAKFGKDCNEDGVTDCFDYMMINHNGGYSCNEPLHSTPTGRRRLQLFQQCRLQ